MLGVHQYVVFLDREKMLGSLPSLRVIFVIFVLSLSNDLVLILNQFKLHDLHIPHFSRSWVPTIGIRAILVFHEERSRLAKNIYEVFFPCLDNNFSDSQPGNFYDEFVSVFHGWFDIKIKSFVAVVHLFTVVLTGSYKKILLLKMKKKMFLSLI